MKHALNDNLLFNPFDNKYTTVIKFKWGRKNGIWQNWFTELKLQYNLAELKNIRKDYNIAMFSLI